MATKTQTQTQAQATTKKVPTTEIIQRITRNPKTGQCYVTPMWAPDKHYPISMEEIVGILTTKNVYTQDSGTDKNGVHWVAKMYYVNQRGSSYHMVWPMTDEVIVAAREWFINHLHPVDQQQQQRVEQQPKNAVRARDPKTGRFVKAA